MEWKKGKSLSKKGKIFSRFSRRGKGFQRDINDNLKGQNRGKKKSKKRLYVSTYITRESTPKALYKFLKNIYVCVDLYELGIDTC